MKIDHIGVIVSNIEKVVSAWNLTQTNPIEEFPSEGTRELYIGSDDEVTFR